MPVGLKTERKLVKGQTDLHQKEQMKAGITDVLRLNALRGMIPGPGNQKSNLVLAKLAGMMEIGSTALPIPEPDHSEERPHVQMSGKYNGNDSSRNKDPFSGSAHKAGIAYSGIKLRKEVQVATADLPPHNLSGEVAVPLRIEVRRKLPVERLPAGVEGSYFCDYSRGMSCALQR